MDTIYLTGKDKLPLFVCPYTLIPFLSLEERILFAKAAKGTRVVVTHADGFCIGFLEKKLTNPQQILTGVRIRIEYRLRTEQPTNCTANSIAVDLMDYSESDCRFEHHRLWRKYELSSTSHYRFSDSTNPQDVRFEGVVFWKDGISTGDISKYRNLDKFTIYDQTFTPYKGWHPLGTHDEENSPSETPQGAMEWFQSNMSEGTLSLAGTISLLYVIASAVALLTAIGMALMWGSGMIQIVALLNAIYLGIGFIVSPAATAKRPNRQLAQKTTAMVCWLPATAYLHAGGGEYTASKKAIAALEGEKEVKYSAEQVRQIQARHAFDIFYKVETAMIPLGRKKSGYAWSVSAVPRDSALDCFPFLVEEIKSGTADFASQGENMMAVAKTELMLDRGEYAMYLFREAADREMDSDSTAEQVFKDLKVSLDATATMLEVDAEATGSEVAIRTSTILNGSLAMGMWEARQAQEQKDQEFEAADQEILSVKQARDKAIKEEALLKAQAELEKAEKAKAQAASKLEELAPKDVTVADVSSLETTNSPTSSKTSSEEGGTDPKEPDPISVSKSTTETDSEDGSSTDGPKDLEQELIPPTTNTFPRSGTGRFVNTRSSRRVVDVKEL